MPINMKLKFLLIITLSLSVGLYSSPAKGSSAAHVEENTSSHSDNENINEGDMICSKETSSVVLTLSYSNHTSGNIYESPIMPVIIGSPKSLVKNQLLHRTFQFVVKQ